MFAPQPSGHEGDSDPVTPPSLIDAQAAAALLNVPASWILAQARKDAIPHIRLGRYVRFDPSELLAWARDGQRRGPRAGGVA